MTSFQLVVAGGGPAGLFCALQTAKKGIRVLLLEKKSSCGKKLLITGSGQCNLTHDGDIPSFLTHYGDNGKFLKPSLLNFTNQNLIAFFEKHGIVMEHEPGGKIFPASRKVRDILDILLDECALAGVDIHCDEPVQSLDKTEDGFCIRTGTGEYLADAVVIATGGITYPQTGSTGDGFFLATELGHPVTDAGPALTGVFIKNYPFAELSGMSFADRTISLFRDGKKVRSHTGDLLFTHTGLSGPGILDFSRYIRPGDTLKISLVDDSDPVSCKNAMIQMMAEGKGRQVKTALAGFDLPDRLVRSLLEIAGIDHELTASHLSKKDRNSLLELITAFPFVVDQLMGTGEAMVTRGGASIEAINQKTMESRAVSGLFFAGEVIDIDGDCGGYNLQAAFSTGALAAEGVNRFLEKNQK
jgi:hypothetical protein